MNIQMRSWNGGLSLSTDTQIANALDIDQHLVRLIASLNGICRGYWLKEAV